MRRSQWPLYLALVAFGLALLSGFYAYNRFFQTVPALVANHDLAVGSELTPDSVRVIRVPAGGRPPQALFGPGQIAGMYAVAPLFEGELLSARHVTSTPPVQDPLASIAVGQRIISVPVRPETVLGGALNAGDRVDVVAAWPAREGAPATTQVVASSVQVMDSRNSAGLSTYSTGEESDPGSRVPTSVLLLVSSDQAHTLVAAVEAKAAVYLWLTEREHK